MSKIEVRLRRIVCEALHLATAPGNLVDPEKQKGHTTV
jgi:hypothetical protein